MKCWKQSPKKQRNEGSMVVEAAMVLPLFLLFVLFLIFIIQMTLYSTALQSTASDTVKVISTHIYPAALAAQKGAAAEDTTGEAAGGMSTGKWTVPRLSVEDWSSSYVEGLPAPVDEWVKAAVQRAEGPLQELQAEASEAVLDHVLKPLMKPYLATDWLDYERLHVSNVTIPDLKQGTRPYFGLVVSYELPMKVPFLNKPIVLEASSLERIWVGNTDASGQGGESGNEGQQGFIIVLEKPDPGVANKQGKIKVKVPAGETANLSIFYKSGQSTAKYLGWKQADESGYIEWEWKIGVNTTPGTWTFVVTLEDGTSLTETFTVVKRF
ncbi:TadE/TadG family type IV pilus assembly protein [Paenibacillus sp. FSL R7-0345]|uniref:TadE/TadG family type IV pilus assembly protein n=1 Tax=Paenibacillus sp. FSL R7-0345 TaxID=2954535 RepID=UPI00315B2519